MAAEEYTPEELLNVFPEDWIQNTDIYQQGMWRLSLRALMDYPFPDEVSDEDKQLAKLAKNNITTYDHEIEKRLLDDPLLADLEERHVKELIRYKNNENFTHLIRVRRTITAFAIFHAAKDHTIAR